jgi:hypothetical protein
MSEKFKIKDVRRMAAVILGLGIAVRGKMVLALTGCLGVADLKRKPPLRTIF